MTDNQPYLWNGKAYEVQTWYTDGWCVVTSEVKIRTSVINLMRVCPKVNNEVTEAPKWAQRLCVPRLTFCTSSNVRGQGHQVAPGGCWSHHLQGVGDSTTACMTCLFIAHFMSDRMVFSICRFTEWPIIAELMSVRWSLAVFTTTALWVAELISVRWSLAVFTTTALWVAELMSVRWSLAVFTTTALWVVELISVRWSLAVFTTTALWVTELISVRWSLAVFTATALWIVGH